MTDTAASTTPLCRYRYDALDRLAAIHPQGQTSMARFYQKGRLTVEIQSAVRRRIVECSGRLLAEDGVDDSAVLTDLLGADAQGSVLHALSSQGRQSLAYSPYGHHLQGRILSGFNGERPDPMTGHYLLGNGYRAFNPALMRFNQPDSLSPFGRGGMNAYAYGLGDPVNNNDPSGHMPMAAALSRPSRFEELPLEMLEKIVKRLPLKDSFNLSRTSRRMREKVPALVASPRIDVEDPGALSVIKRHLKGQTNLSPASLRNDPFYRAQFEQVAKGIAGSMDDQINSLNRQKRSILDRATKRQGASYVQFEAKVARDRRLYADDPDIQDDINWVVSEYRRLDAEEHSLIHKSADMGRLIDTIRSSFNAR